MDAPERDSDKFSSDGVGDQSAQRRFSHTRRPYEYKNGPAHVVLQLANREVFEYPALHLVKTIMIMLQTFPGVSDIERVLGTDTPWKVKNPVQIVARHSILRRRRIQLREFTEFLFRDLLGFLWKMRFLHPLLQGNNLNIPLVFSQFLLNSFHLLTEVILSL